MRHSVLVGIRHRRFVVIQVDIWAMVLLIWFSASWREWDNKIWTIVCRQRRGDDQQMMRKLVSQCSVGQFLSAIDVCCLSIYLSVHAFICHYAYSFLPVTITASTTTTATTTGSTVILQPTSPSGSGRPTKSQKCRCCFSLNCLNEN